MKKIVSLILIMILVSTAFNKESTKKFLIIGDSLTDGYGLTREEAWPYLLQQKFNAQNMGITIINAGTSGATSSSGPAKLKWQLAKKPQWVLLALGSNDGLRGVSPEKTKKNIRAMIKICKDKGIKPLLIQFRLPPSMGEDYTKKFEQVFIDLSKEEKIPLLPFLLNGVYGEKDKNLSDGIHPNELGHQIIAKNMFTNLKGYLQ